MNGIEMLKSVQYVVDQEGHPEAVQISIQGWEALLDLLEDLEDHTIIKEALPRLRAGPEESRALAWDTVRDQWDSPSPDEGANGEE